MSKIAEYFRTAAQVELDVAAKKEIDKRYTPEQLKDMLATAGLQSINEVFKKFVTDVTVAADTYIERFEKYVDERHKLNTHDIHKLVDSVYGYVDKSNFAIKGYADFCGLKGSKLISVRCELRPGMMYELHKEFASTFNLEIGFDDVIARKIYNLSECFKKGVSLEIKQDIILKVIRNLSVKKNEFVVLPNDYSKYFTGIPITLIRIEEKPLSQVIHDGDIPEHWWTAKKLHEEGYSDEVAARVGSIRVDNFRTKYGNLTKHFDYVDVCLGICLDYEKAKTFCMNNKKELFLLARNYLESNKSFKKYNIPINYFKVGKANVTRQCQLVVTFELKDIPGDEWGNF